MLQIVLSICAGILTVGLLLMLYHLIGLIKEAKGRLVETRSIVRNIDVITKDISKKSPNIAAIIEDTTVAVECVREVMDPDKSKVTRFFKAIGWIRRL